MIPSIGAIYSSRVWRLAHVVCMLAVFCWLLFDVLDLDGSNFPSLLIPDAPVIVAEVPPDIQPYNPSAPARLWENTSALLTDTSTECAWFRLAKIPRSSPLDLARGRGYQVGLARSSIPDSSPYA